MIQSCSLASGSNGNSIFVGTKECKILIDVGVSRKKIVEGLNSMEIDADSLDGIFITHEHIDHVNGLGVMSRKHHVPIYITEPTWRRVKQITKLGIIEEELVHFIKPNEVVKIKDLSIKPFSISHDAIDPVSYTILDGNNKVSIVTDLGCYDEYIVNNIKESNVLYLEANHDVKMLEVGKYPYPLKQRIKSNLGHLSNESTVSLLKEVMSDKLKCVVLAHLSSENNHPDIAYMEVNELIKKYTHTNLFVAKRGTFSKSIII